ncbi:acyltransferase [Zhaonella formicivorans]|jgi:acetyltransferase-like isoleucine patch superfamily enzyme|uniref:acyltransferase n=1 Tax=Zhaonella formicivorans TaxID=2528593 RepID=UPI0010D27BB7|nr:acyltransferase [Zhaonella formicivorans]
MRRLEYYPSPHENAMHYWKRIAHPLKTMKNFIIIQIGRFIPSIRVKNFLYRTFLGMKIGKDVGIGLMAMFDIFHPERITIGDNSVLGYNSTILCHEFLPNEYRLGPVEIGANVLIGANTTVLAGVKIGDGALVSAGSLVNRDVPPYTLAVGVPVKFVKRLKNPQEVTTIHVAENS